MSALTDGIDRARRELAANPRLRAGAWAIVAVLLLYWLLAQADRRAAAGAAHADAAADLARAEAVLSRRDWPQLRDEAQRRFDALAANFWTADNPGLAQAQLEQAISGIIDGLKLRNPTTTLGFDQAVPNAPDLWRVQLRLQFGYPEGAERRVLRAIATHPRRLVVDSLDIDTDRSQVALLVSAYFLGIQTQAEPGASD